MIGLILGAAFVGVIVFLQIRHFKRQEQEIMRTIWGKTNDEERFLP